ncbi:hypothetical protein [Nocardioides conyzicola]|uniref:DUF4179 domain-containing protein n=1 Tax=Nocardioides conyzicola TaxID=1651781 RepID=A0ABP8WM25_9ACTN
MTVLDDLRPRAEHLTEERSHAMLDAVLTAPDPRRRRGRWIAAAGLCGAIAAGGGAYAGGLVPHIVTERFDQMRSGDDAWPSPIDHERQVADVVLSNGKHARVWYADTTDGQCVIRDMTGTVTEPEGFGVGCALWGGSEHDPRRGTYWQTAPDGPAVVYGEFAGVSAHVASVEVTGPGWSRTFAVMDGAFAGEVPAGDEGDRVRFDYLDAGGRSLAHKSDTVLLESE